MEVVLWHFVSGVVERASHYERERSGGRECVGEVRDGERVRAKEEEEEELGELFAGPRSLLLSAVTWVSIAWVVVAWVSVTNRAVLCTCLPGLCRACHR